jgi:type VI secretion system secreted protein VgrG
MQAAGGGSLSAALALGPMAAGLPSAGALASSLSGPPAATQSAPGGGEASGEVAIASAVQAVVGAVGDVGGVSDADKATGPGHSQYKVTGPHTETVGSLKMTGALGAINQNVAVGRSESVGAAHLEATLSDRSESVEGAKSEMSVGLIVVSLADDTESVKGVRGNLVGGAMLEKTKGNHSVTDDIAASFIGAMHKLSAKTKLTLKVGASSVVIDGSGVTIESPLVMLTGATISHTKNVADG